MFVFILFPFLTDYGNEQASFPHRKYTEYLSALLSICCMIFLGFADDVLELRWKHKIYLPTVATLPLLMVYIVNCGSTSVAVPWPLDGYFGNLLNLGWLYYLYMGCLAVFCTNAINILAGINGVECGQSVVIGFSIVIHNLIQLQANDSLRDNNLLSLYLLCPFLGCSLALLKHNWYPSRAFVGDTFCYFAGMTFAAVGILGHFSKTILLFCIPQILNFLYSLPQLFQLVPIPRHRLPLLDESTGLLTMRMVEFKPASLSPAGHRCVKLLKFFRLVCIRPKAGATDGTVEMNNLTLINFILLQSGPTHERTLTIKVMGFQMVCSVVAFLIRYQAAKLFYHRVE